MISMVSSTGTSGVEIYTPYQQYPGLLEHIKNINLGTWECITSYDITASFTCVPVEPARDIIKYKLEQDIELQQRTTVLVHHIIQLLGFCLNNTYFLFHG